MGDAPVFRYRPARRWRDSGWVWLVGVLSVIVTVGVTSSAAMTPAWSLVPLPDDAAAVTLTVYGDELLVGTASTGEPSGPGLVRVHGRARTIVPVVPASGYGAEARWVSMGADDNGALVAVGAARGGAHGNPRWTVWRGTASTGLTEHPQTFETFGGWGAGELVGAVALPSGPVLAGSWESRELGQDAAVWLPSGPATWARRSSAGTPLASTSDELVGVVSATADGSRVLMVGSVTRLGDRSLRQVPAVWRSEPGATSWRRLDLPVSRAGQAAGAACAGGTCTIVGKVDNRLAVWRLKDTAERLDTVPDVPVWSVYLLGPPVVSASGVLLAVPDGCGSRLLRWTGGNWTSLSGLPHRIRALAVVGSVAYAVEETGRLWAGHL